MNSQKNILFISYDGLTDPLGQSQIIPYLVGLSSMGYYITILSCEKKERFLRHSATIQSILDKSAINWAPVSYNKNPPVISTLYNLAKMYYIAVTIMRDKKISLIHCRSTLSALIGKQLQRKYPSKILFDMRGFWADERVEGGLWPQSNLTYRLIYKFIKKNELQLITSVDHIISLTHEGKRIIEEEIPLSKKPAPVTIIPCCVDLHLFNPLNYPKNELNKLKQKLNLNEQSFVLSYLGSIGTWYMLNEMLDFFKLLQQKMNDACFLFITKENPETILNAAFLKDLKPDSIRIIAAERNEIPPLLLISTASIFFIRPGFSKKASSPTKLGESLATGLPIISNSGVGDNDYFMSNNHCGWIVNSFDEMNYKEVINEIQKNAFPKSDEIRKVGEKYFSLQRAVEIYDGVYKQLLS